MKMLLFFSLGISVFLCIGFGSDKPGKNDMPGNSVELGERLFFDPILSKDYKISCASCHKPEFAFADSNAFSIGVDSALTVRNTPSILYLDLTQVIFWDGRAQTIFHQAFFPITHAKEMGMTRDGAVERLNKNKFYKAAFMKIYNTSPNVVNISNALADFQRSLLFYNSPYDRFYLGDDSAISEEAIDGLMVFNSKGNCEACHRLGKGWHDLSAIRNIGLYNGKDRNDQGKYAITHDSADLGRFKVPLLRNIALTAPYMHDGSLKTLREVIEFYNTPSKFVTGSINKDEEMKDSLGLTEKEMHDLEVFLRTLTDDSLQYKLKRYNRVVAN